MNELTTSPQPSTASSLEANQQTSGTAQVLLPRVLVQRIKDELKTLKKDTGVDYGIVHFVMRVLDKHWTADMEQLRRGLEKLNASK